MIHILFAYMILMYYILFFISLIFIYIRVGQ